MRGVTYGLVCILAVSFCAPVFAQQPVISSFSSNGQLECGGLVPGSTCTVEWASSVDGPWTNTWNGLDNVPVDSNGEIAVSVPVSRPSLFYRVRGEAATAAVDYLVIDLSAGPSAASYPVSYLTAVPPAGWTDEYKTTKLVMRRIPAGVFTMGSPTNELGRNSNETEHQVTLTRDFYIGVFEVTQRQWELVTGYRPSYFNNPTYYASRPVEQLTYYVIRENPANSAISPNWPQSSQVHAESFVGKLRAKTALSTLDLPTEAQWEYACRAGTTTALNSGFNLTSTESDPRMDSVGRYWYNGGSVYSQGCGPNAGTAVVGSYLPNAWGLYDMQGNVWEWCLDGYGTYPGSVEDPSGAASGSDRLIRGGSWSFSAAYSRSAHRFDITPSFWSEDFGFRLARTLP